MKLSDWRMRNGRSGISNWKAPVPLEGWMVLALLALAVALRVIALGKDSLWFDETYTMLFAREQLSVSTLLLPGGTYLAALHFWLVFGQTEFIIRLLSVLFGVATVAVVFIVALRLFGWKPALWTAGLLAIAPFQIWYSREVRMYTLAALFAWLAAWAAIEATYGRRRWLWVLYGLAAVFGLYTHSFVAFLLIAVNLWIISVFILDAPKRKAIVPWAIANVAAVALAVPVVTAVGEQRSLGWWGWIADKYGVPTLSDLMQLGATFAMGTVHIEWRWLWWLAVAVWAAAFVIGLVPPLRAKVRGGESENRSMGARVTAWWQAGGREWTCIAALAVVPISLIFVVSQFTPVFVARYTFAFMPAFALVAARGISRLRFRATRWGLALPYLGAVGLVLMTMWFTPQKEDWRGAAAYLSNNAPINAAVFLVDEDCRVPFEYYYKRPVELTTIWRGHTQDVDLSPKIDPVVQSRTEFWLVVSHDDNDAVEQYLLRYADVVERAEFKDVTVMHLHLRGGGA